MKAKLRSSCYKTYYYKYYDTMFIKFPWQKSACQILTESTAP